MSRSIYNLLLIVILAVAGSGCKKKADHVANISANNLTNHFAIDGKQSVLYIERPGNLDCVFSWSSFLDFGKYDLTDVQSGTIKLKTGTSTGGGRSNLYDPELGDRVEFDFDEILLSWVNESTVVHLQITTAPVAVVPDPDDVTISTKLFNLETGVAFQIVNWTTMVNPEILQFSIWGSKTTNGVKEYIKLIGKPFNYPRIASASPVFNILFNKSAFSSTSMAGKQNLTWTDLNLDTTQFNIDITTSTDTRFERIVSECSKEVFDNRIFLKDSKNPLLDFELAYVDACLPNVRRYFTDAMLSRTLSGRPRRYPAVDTMLDKSLVLFTNINETIHAINELSDDLDHWWNVHNWSFRGLEALDEDLPQLDEFIRALINQTSGNFNAGLFSKLILSHTDYLLYGGLACLFDPDFNSRYFNHLNGIVREIDNLLTWFGSAFGYNNIVIRFYAVASLYDFMKTNGDIGYYNKFSQYLQGKCAPTGEYGEGYDYLNYIYSVALPVMYLGVQEEYTMGPKIGQKWIDANSPGVSTFINTARRMIDASDKWGELPAYNDGFNTSTWLTPFSVLADDRLFKDYTDKVEDFVNGSWQESDIIGAFGLPNAAVRMLTYPLGRTFTSNNTFNPGDSAIVTGNVVKMHVTNTTATYTDMVSLSLIAEEDPVYAGTHDKIDHGAIQLNRYVNRGNGNEHVSHLIISPGYPGYNENKRGTEEWKFENQNSVMMYNRDIENTDTVVLPTLPVVFNSGEFNIDLPTPLNPKIFAGMSGYRYLSYNEVKDMILEKMTSSNIMAGIAAGKNKAFTVKGDAGGKSEVVRKFRNGVQTKITYNYRYPHDAYIGFQYDAFWHRMVEVNKVDIVLRTDCSGRREVYNLGNSFYVVDRFLPGEHPSISNLDFATSWNLPANTVAVPGRPGCFEGSRPDSGTVQSRLQICGKAFTTTPTLTGKSFQLTKEIFNQGRFHRINQIGFENDLSSTNFLMCCISVVDGTEGFRTISSETFNTTSNITIWTREYTGGSSQQVIFNPLNNSYTVNGITSDAYIWIIDSVSAVSGSARLFGLTTVNAGTHTIIINQGGQCDINL